MGAKSLDAIRLYIKIWKWISITILVISAFFLAGAGLWTIINLLAIRMGAEGFAWLGSSHWVGAITWSLIVLISAFSVVQEWPENYDDFTDREKKRTKNRFWFVIVLLLVSALLFIPTLFTGAYLVWRIVIWCVLVFGIPGAIAIFMTNQRREP